MKLNEIADNTPLVLMLVRNLLDKEESVSILDGDGRVRHLKFVVLRGLDDVWVLRSVNPKHFGSNTRDTRIPSELDIDSLLKLEQVPDGWMIIPDWQKLIELGVFY